MSIKIIDKSHWAAIRVHKGKNSYKAILEKDYGECSCLGEAAEQFLADFPNHYSTDEKINQQLHNEDCIFGLTERSHSVITSTALVTSLYRDDYVFLGQPGEWLYPISLNIITPDGKDAYHQLETDYLVAS